MGGDSLKKYDMLCYVIGREEVEKQDISRFLEVFKPKHAGESIDVEMGKVNFSFDGYDGDPREIYHIPEVRVWVAKVQTAWPCWLFYSELETKSLASIALCALESCAPIKRSDGMLRDIDISSIEMYHFIRAGMIPMTTLAKARGISQDGLKIQFERVLNALGMGGLANGDYFDGMWNAPQTEI